MFGSGFLYHSSLQTLVKAFLPCRKNAQVPQNDLFHPSRRGSAISKFGLQMQLCVWLGFFSQCFASIQPPPPKKTRKPKPWQPFVFLRKDAHVEWWQPSGPSPWLRRFGPAVIVLLFSAVDLKCRSIGCQLLWLFVCWTWHCQLWPLYRLMINRNAKSSQETLTDIRLRKYPKSVSRRVHFASSLWGFHHLLPEQLFHTFVLSVFNTHTRTHTPLLCS